MLFYYLERRHVDISPVARNISAVLRNTSIGIYLGDKSNVAYFQRYFTAQTGWYLRPQHVCLTTGFLGVVISLHTCDSITVFGAVSKHHCDSGLVSKNVPYAYFPSRQGKLCDFMRSRLTVTRISRNIIFTSSGASEEKFKPCFLEIESFPLNFPENSPNASSCLLIKLILKSADLEKGRIFVLFWQIRHTIASNGVALIFKNFWSLLEIPYGDLLIFEISRCDLRMKF